MKRYNFDISDLPGEEWKPITHWRGHEIVPYYEISNLGRLKHTGREVIQRNAYVTYTHVYKPHMLNLSDDQDGYLISALTTVDGKHIDVRIHQVVAKYFIGEPPTAEHTHVNHIDGNKHNNAVTNLEWATPYENNLHARVTGLARLGTSQAIKCKFEEWDTIFSSKTQASLATGHAGGYIYDCEQHGFQMKDAKTGQLLHLIYIKE